MSAPGKIIVIHFQDDQIWFWCMLKWMGGGVDTFPLSSQSQKMEAALFSEPSEQTSY